MHDWIALIEAAYSLAPGLEPWLDGLAEAAWPILECGDGTSAQAFRLVPGGVCFDGVGVAGDAGLREGARESIRGASAPGVDRVYRNPTSAATLSEILFPDDPDEELRFRASQDDRFRDAIGIVAHAGFGRGVALNAPLREPARMAPAARSRWERIAVHVGAAHRLRLALTDRDLEDRSVEAVLDASGRVRDARGPAQAVSAQEVLRGAVQRIERARGALRRRDPDEALSLWTGLVRGRWSLVDHFDSDGRRFVVARHNEPGLDDPRGLTPRELQTAELLGFGHAPKEIAYALGIHDATVRDALLRARRKLNLRSAAELAAFFAPAGMRQRLEELRIAGEPLAVGSMPLADPAALEGLTSAESAVLLMLLQGATNREIAARRGAAERTVTNQVQAVFRKLGAHSRADLATRLQEGAGASAP